MIYRFTLLAILASSTTVRAQALDDPLPPAAVARLGTARFKHIPGWYVHRAIYSPDGKRIASASRGGGEVILWDAATGKELARCGSVVAGHAHALAFSPDGAVLAIGKNKAIILVDTATFKDLHTLKGHAAEVQALRFVDGGKTLISAGGEGLVAWWDVASGTQQRTWKPLAAEQEAHAATKEFEYVMTAALAPGGKALAMQTVWRRKRGQYDNEVVVFDLVGGKRNWSAGGGEFMHMAFAPDGQRLAVSRQERHLELRETASGRSLAAYVFPGSSDDFSSFHNLAFAPDGNTVAVTGAALQVGLWSLDDTTTMRKLTGRFAEGAWAVVGCVAFAPDSKTVLLAVNSDLQLYEVATNRELLPWPGHRGPVEYVAFAEGGTQFVSADGDGSSGGPSEVLRWRVPDWQLLHRSRAKVARHAGALAVSQEHKVFIDGDSRFVDMTTQDVLGKLDRMVVPSKGFKTQFSPSGQHYLWEGREAIQVFAVPSGRLLCRLPLLRGGNVFSGDESYIALFALGGASIHIYTTADGELVRQIKIAKSQRANAAFSPDGKQLASWSSDDNAIRLWDLATGKERHRFQGKARPDFDVAICLAWSPDGRTLAAGGMDDPRNIQLWEILSGRMRRELRGHVGAVTALGFSPDGRLLASGSADTTVLVWDIWGG
jgi:WD40 repeat protein